MLSLRWTYEGVNHSIDGNGGPDCRSYLTLCRRLWESLFIGALSCAYTYWGYRKVRLPQHPPKKRPGHRDRLGKKLLLILICLTFGCELGFKCATKTLIYLLNPCHIVTLVQIFLLAAPPCRLVTAVFRWHMHSLNGAVLAIIFPVVNTRLLPFEMEVYYLQHITMLVIPFYLLRIGGIYTVEKLSDFSWTLLTLGSWLLYHFVPLQFLGLLTEVNLNNMLCPAISDPFRGQNYRIWATGHQSLLIAILGKLYYSISCAILRFTRSAEAEASHCNGDSVNGLTVVDNNVRHEHSHKNGSLENHRYDISNKMD